jgi:hypothetical protein
MKIQESERDGDGQPGSYFCKMQKYVRLGGKNLRIFAIFLTIDRSTIEHRRDRSNFDGQYKLKIELSIESVRQQSVLNRHAVIKFNLHLG